MIRVVFTVILLFFLISWGQSFAQNTPEGIKIYSGYLHQYNLNNKGSLWHALFGPKSPKQDEVNYDRPCFIEFKSPVPFSHQPVAVVPEALTYAIQFKHVLQTPGVNSTQGKDPFAKFVVKIYTNDGEDYSIVPDSVGKIFDSYLIYLILGSDINHLEIVSTSADSQDKYILDKLEIHDNH